MWSSVQFLKRRTKGKCATHRDVEMLRNRRSTPALLSQPDPAFRSDGRCSRQSVCLEHVIYGRKNNSLKERQIVPFFT
jgi:hypothetical protein